MKFATSSLGTSKILIAALIAALLPALAPPSPVSASSDIPDQGQNIVAVGANHALAIDVNGQLFAWGDNTNGQLGTGTGLDANVPVAVSTAGFPVATRFISVAAYSDTSIALASNGQLYSWGNNSTGQLGDGTFVNRATPVEVSISGVVFKQIAVARSHALALAADGSIYSWGKNNSGQLGDGSKVDTVVPIQVDTSGIVGSKVFVSIAAGSGWSNGYSFGVTDDGAIYGWGENSYDQLGDGTSIDQTLPVALDTSNVAAGVKFASVSAGEGHTLSLTSDGKIYGWGSNWLGAVGDGSNTDRAIPVLVAASGPMSGESVVAISAGPYHSLALTSTGQLFAWGSGSAGVLGNGTRAGANSPSTVSPSSFPVGTDFRSVAAGANTSIAITRAGQLFGWGYNGDGQLGIGLETLFQTTPIAVSTNGLPINTTFSSIAVGYDHTLALSSEGLIYAWGDNTKGQLGNGTQSTSAVPVAVSNTNFPAGTTFSQIVSGKQYSMALSADGIVYAWGDNSSGQLGDGTTVESTLPLEVSRAGMPDSTKTFSSIAVGWYHSLALTADGELFTWGSNAFAQLARNNVFPGNRIPTPADSSKRPSGVTFSDLAANPLTTLALGSDGRIYGWGYNYYGQLGDGSKTLATSFTRVSIAGALTGKTIVQLGGGTHHFVGLDSAGDLYGWGANKNEQSDFIGQLGVGGSPAESTVPLNVDLTSVPNGTNFASVSAGYYSSVAISSAGDLYAWGENSAGQLGSGTQTDLSVPTAVSTDSLPVGTTFKDFRVGSEHSVALTVDGQLYAQGKRDAGRLGDGVSTLYQLIPAAISFQALEFVPAQSSTPNAPVDSPPPSYSGPTLGVVNQSVTAGTAIVFPGARLDSVTAIYVGQSKVEITSQSAHSVTIDLPTTLAAGSYDLVLYSSYGRLTVMGALSVSASSLQDSSSSSSIGPELIEAEAALSNAAKLLIGSSKFMPAFATAQTDLSVLQATWLQARLEDSGLTRIVCTGLVTESMTTHQRIRVRKLAQAACSEASEILGKSSVWYQSRITSTGRFVGLVMVTFKG